MISIKNIIFDLGGVLLRKKPVSVLDDLDIDNETYNELKRFFDNWNDLDLGNITLEKKYLECNFPKEYDSLYKEYLVNFYKYRKINKDLIKCIELLKNNNYKVYVLSDNVKGCFDFYKNNPLFKDLDGWVLSCDYHEVKETGKLFDILLNNYGLESHECYFIDDSEINVKEAGKRGIKGYIFNEEKDIQELYNDMRNNKIMI